MLVILQLDSKLLDVFRLLIILCNDWQILIHVICRILIKTVMNILTEDLFQVCAVLHQCSSEDTSASELMAAATAVFLTRMVVIGFCQICLRAAVTLLIVIIKIHEIWCTGSLALRASSVDVTTLMMRRHHFHNLLTWQITRKICRRRIAECRVLLARWQQSQTASEKW